MKETQTQIDSKLKERLKKYAKKEGYTLLGLLNKIVSEFLVDKGVK